MSRFTHTLLFALLAVLAYTPAANAQDDNDGDGYTVDDGDCDDCDDTVHPGAVETCNEVDDDCDGDVDEGFDLNEDGFTDCHDDDGDGFTEEQGDCDDHDATISPGIPESCNGIDDDCDGEIDQGMDGLVTSIELDGTSDCVDNDGDGQAEINGDCDDGEPLVYLDEAELLCLDGMDNDCDGAIDYDDPDCQQRAEEASGIVCDCMAEGEGEEETAARIRRGGWVFGALLIFAASRRRLAP